MKLMMLMLTAALMQVHAASFGQLVSLRQKQAPLETVFEEITRQTGFQIVCDGSLIDKAIPTDIDVNNAPATEVLQRFFPGRSLVFVIKDRSLIIAEQPKSRNPKDHDTQASIARLMGYPEVRGRVTDSIGNPLAGASIRVKGYKLSTSTDKQGFFMLRNVPENATLVISYIGYIPQEVKAKGDVGVVVLKAASSELDEAEVMVSTGYYSVPKERSTGSFTHIDNELLNRSVGDNILDRLEGITNGLQFDRRKVAGENITAEPEIRVRGLSTIEGDSRPLIVVDSFPYEGDLSALNPNDVDGVTILKDAAAASIWGARAGNGVIVITTKKGNFNQPIKVHVNSSVNIIQKPDLFYNQSVLPSATVMDIQQELFERKAYAENPQTPIPLYIELLIKQRDNKITEDYFKQEKALMQQTDIRNEASTHFYQPAINQQYAVNLVGGGNVHRYAVSAGYDRNRALLKGNQNNRLNLSMQNTFKVRTGLELSGGMWYSNQQGRQNAVEGIGWDPRNPYARLTDKEGNALPIVYGYRMAYQEAATEQGLLDWLYRPVDELSLTDNLKEEQQIRLNGNVQYCILDVLSMNATYQYMLEQSDGSIMYDKDSYYVRNLVNKYTQADGSKPIPEGNILEQGIKSGSKSHTGRLQLNYRQSFASTHEIAIIAGAEMSQQIIDSDPALLYLGYNNETGLSSSPYSYNYNLMYPLRPNGYGYIPSSPGISERYTNRNISYFSNASYTLSEKYIFSASARWDGSNLLGVKTNQRGTALWSVGGSWDVGSENLYGLSHIIPYLRIRATYGTSGNIDKSQSYYPTIRTETDPLTKLPYSVLTSPGNPSLRWEQVNTLNLGMDWQWIEKRFSGSLEFFNKQSNYLLGNRLKDPTLGLGMYDNFKENYGNMRTHGWDMEINSVNLKDVLKWETSLLLNYTRNKITKIDDLSFTTLVSDYINGSYPVPVKGRSLDVLYALPWKGLNPETGQPMVFLNNEVSNDYPAYYASLQPKDLVVAGVEVSPWYGSLRNTMTWKNIKLSAMISFKAGYVFRRGSMAPGGEYNTSPRFHLDYFKRWQKPGDEQHTDVPGRTETYVEQQAWVYERSMALITAADAIRLTDIRFSYSFNRHILRHMTLQNLQIYGYARNLGILWRANKQGLDPEYAYGAYPAPKSFALGLQMDF